MVLTKPDILTVGSALETFNLRGLYILGYGWLFGMCMSLSFFRIQGMLSPARDRHSNLGNVHRR